MQGELEKLYEELLKDKEIDRQQDGEVEELSKEIKGVLEEELEAYFEDEDCDDRIENILIDDDYLLEELVDKMALLNVLEMPSEEEPDRDTREAAWLSLADSFFELSKAVNPLGGFGEDRLTAGLELLHQFEEKYWPLSTRVTGENVEAFEEFLPEPIMDDVRLGRKRAIGVLRHVEGEMCAAGVAVYTVDEDYDEEAPLIRPEWIFVHPQLRRQGLGNYLMAQLLELTLQNEGSGLAVEIPVLREEDSEEAFEEMSVLQNFLDSWKLQFVVSGSNYFRLNIADVKHNKNLDALGKEAVSLRKLAERGEILLRDYFRKGNAEELGDVSSLPYEYFDADVSSVILAGDRIKALFLVHRFESGNYRYELMRYADREEALELLRTAYVSAIKSKSRENVLYGTFESLEGRELIAELLPETQLMMVFSGTLFPPEEPISSVDWARLRKEAGFSDDKVPDEEDSDETDAEEKVSAFLNAWMGNGIEQ